MTHQGLSTCVHFHVSSQHGFDRKSRITLFTRVRFFAGMSSDMSEQIAQFLEAFLTLSTLVAVHLFLHHRLLNLNLLSSRTPRYHTLEYYLSHETSLPIL